MNNKMQNQTDYLNKIDLSVIIPCLNEEKYVGKLLNDLSKQTEDVDFEVVVVDSNSSDQTAAVARQFSNKLPLQVIELTQRGAAKARNAGAKAASGQYLLFLDADLRIPSHFIQTFMKERAQKNADMMTTHYRASGWHPFDNAFYYWGSWYFEQTFKDGAPEMSGCVQFVKKDLHVQVGGYNENLSVGEDVDYSKRVREVAENPHFIGSLKVIASSRRFRQDGRITMLLRGYQWESGKQLDIQAVDSFEFGHYRKGSKKIRLIDLATNWYLLKSVVRVLLFNVKTYFKIKLH